MAKAREIRGLTCDESLRSAAGKILWTRFEEIMSFREAVLKPVSEEAAVDAIHDMRVASRRLRASLEVFVDVFPSKPYRSMLGSIKNLADALGEVRDIDVMTGRLRDSRKGRSQAQREALDGLVAQIENGRESARSELRSLIEELERTNFPRKFALFVAEATV